MNKKRYTNDDKKRGQRIRAVRKKNHLTQEELAELFDISVSMVKKLESGENNITLSELRCLKNKFNVSSDFILFGEVNNGKHFEYQFESAPVEEKMQIFLNILFQLCGGDNEKFIAFLEKVLEQIYQNNYNRGIKRL